MNEDDMYNASKQTIYQRVLDWSIEEICTDTYSDSINSFINNSDTDVTRA